MRKIITPLIGICIIISLCGCTAFLIGAGTAGGVATVGIDTLRLSRYTSFENAWSAVIDSFNDSNIKVTSQDKKNGLISSFQEQSIIQAQIRKKGDEPVRIDIKVRKKGLPDLKSAEQIINKINNKLAKKIINE
ncbi:MAG: hypothetical protein DRP78_05730 [Candidatus Omnitrophota bacterium]|nr:MAG: hypothetical protein DRP78_05730 [Candidatus Omnitrophota bacterium]